MYVQRTLQIIFTDRNVCLVLHDGGGGGGRRWWWWEEVEVVVVDVVEQRKEKEMETQPGVPAWLQVVAGVLSPKCH